MPCYHPITAFQPHGGGPLSFTNKKDHNTLTIPCGQCWGCRLARSRDWAIRCMHEAQMHKHNAYITLTYDELHLPANSTLVYKDFQAFMRRLRKALGRGKSGLLHSGHTTKTVRFYMGAEYGEQHGRPHFHACLFGVDFADRLYLKKNESGERLYTSALLTKLWGKGFASVGNVTFKSAAYIARYIMKKLTGNKSNQYEITDTQTGEITNRKTEFNQMSRRPGLGKTWLDKYHLDVFPHGKVVLAGHQINAPRYYDNYFKAIDELGHETLKDLRRKEALAQTEHHTDERLLVQETVAKAKTRSLKRTID